MAPPSSLPSSSSSSSASTDSLSLPSGPVRLTPPGSPQDTFGGHSVDLSSPLSPNTLSPLSARPTSLATTGTGTGSRASPHTGADPLPGLAAASGSRLSSSTSATSTGPSSSSGPSTTSPSQTPATTTGALPASGSFGPTAGPSLAVALSARERELRDRPLSLGSVVESEMSFAYSYSAQSPHSQRNSWLNPSPVSPSASTAAIVIARKLRLSAGGNLGPLLSSSMSGLSGYGPSSSTGAGPSGTTAESSTLGPRSSTSAVGGSGVTAAPSGVGAAASSSSSSLQPPSAVYSPGAPLSPTSSLFSRRSRASYARPRPRAHSPDEPLPSPLGANSFASTTFPSMSPRATPTDFTSRDLPLPGELPLPHYSFLDEDPALGSGGDSPSSVRGGVSQFSGSCGPNNRASAQSVPVSEPAARLKHLSAQSGQSGFSETSMPGMPTNVAPSTPSGSGRPSGGLLARWSLFAGGPPPAWGRRDSLRSVKSNKSSKSTKSTTTKKRSSKHASLVSSRGHGGDEEIVKDDEWEKDDASVDLSVLVRRAAILERLLRAGKRASGVANSKRISAVSTSTHYSGVTSKQSGYGGRSNGVSNSRSGGSGQPEKSTSNSQRRSAQSLGSGVRQRIAHRLGLGPSHPFTGLSSDDSDTNTTTSHSGSGDFVDLASDNTSASSHYLAPPGTPPRRAVSTSISRRDHEVASPGQGSGVIVFPELATMPPPEAIRRDGEVCAQSCLPASVAIPYTPLSPPPPTAKVHSSRSLHSLRNLRFVDEKHAIQFGSWSNASGPTRHSQHSSMLIGDVPNCDEREVGPRQRRLKIMLIVASIIVVALIAGLLGGLLARRQKKGQLSN